MPRHTTNLPTALLALMAVTTIAQADVLNVPGDHPTIQAAIVASSHGDEVVVAPGTYVESIDYLGRAITVRGTDPSDPAVVAATIIDGNGADHVVQCVNGEGPGSVLAGFTITGGRGDWNEPGPSGAGMLNVGSSPTVRDCVFTGNYAYGRGGGMYNNGGAPTIERCTFEGNDAGSGGGMFNSNSNATLIECTFTANDSFEDVGGGLFNVNGNVTLDRCGFYSNTASEEGGAGNQGGSAVYTDCTFVGNVADGSGGGMSNFFGAAVTIERCTFMNNTAGNLGAAIRNHQATPTLIDTVVCGNGTDQINGAYTDGGGNNINAVCVPLEPTGACCFDGVCITVTAADCGAVGGTFQGQYSACGLVSCPPAPTPCPGDANSDGLVDVTDLLDLLGAWGACP